MEKKGKEEYKILGEHILLGMETGYFDFVAHPDRIFQNIGKWEKECEKISGKIKRKAKEKGVPIEYNLSSKRQAGLMREEFWKETEKGQEVIVGLDAHSVRDMEIGWYEQKDCKIKSGACPCGCRFCPYA